jgi:PAS domain S-box-containing protein
MGAEHMTLRTKTMIIVSVTTFSLILILYVASQTILLGSFVELEEHLVSRNVERALSVFSDEIIVLDTMVFDWAAWDDTYAFIQNPNQEYVHSNLVDETFTSPRLNLMLFVNSSGQVVFAKAFDLQSEAEVPVPSSLRSHLTEDSPLLRHPNTESSVAGIVLLPEGPVLVASRPILTSVEQGPIRGTLIFGRYLSAAEAERLADKTHLSLTWHRFDTAQMLPEFQTASLSLSREAPIFVQPLSADSIAGYALLEDIYGKPGLVLRVDMPRDIYKQGQTSALYFISALLAVSLVFGLVTLLLLEKVVLSRLARLSVSVRSIGASGDLSERVSVTGRDELSSLASTINEMLAALRVSEQRFRDVARTAGDWIWETDAEGQYTYASPVVEQVLGYTPEEVVGRHYYDFFHPDEREGLKTIFQEVLRGKEPFVHLASPSVHKDGHLVFLETSGLPLIDAQGSFLGYRGAHRDVTAERRLEERLSTVYILGRELVLSRDERRIIEAVVEAAKLLLLQGQLCDLWLMDGDGEVLSREAVKAPGSVTDIATLSLDGERGITVTVAQTGEPIYLPDVREDSRYVDAGMDSRSELCVPLLMGEQVIGVLNAESDRLDAFDKEEQRLFSTLADQAALAIENARLYEQMRAGRDRLQTLSRRLVEVQEIERRRLARELHDEVGQLLTGLKLLLEMSMRLPPDAVEDSLDEARTLADELLARVRELSLDLRPTMLDDLGLLPALLWHFERYTAQTNVRVNFRHTGLERRRFVPEIETATYRIVQEALTNVARHAGVGEVTVQLWADQDTLGVRVEDDGVGFDAETMLALGTSSGLSGMQERASLLGAQLTIESAPGAGTRLTTEFSVSE